MSRGIFAYLTRSGNPKKKDEQQKKKKRRWLFRRAESSSSLNDDRYNGFYGNAGPSFAGASPYGDISPNQFFSKTGLQKDGEILEKQHKRGVAAERKAKEPEVNLSLDDFDLPQANVLRRPSLYEVFDNNAAKKEPTRTLGPSIMLDENERNERNEDDSEEDDDEEEEITSPYEQDSFHQRKDSKASWSSSDNRMKAVSPQTSDGDLYNRRKDRKNVRSLTEESIAVYSEAHADSRVKKHGREKLRNMPPQPPYFPFHPMPIPPHLYNNGKDRDNSFPPPFLPPPPPGYRYPPPHPHMMFYPHPLPPPPHPSQRHPHPHYPHGVPFPPPPGYPPFFPPLQEDERELVEGEKRKQRKKQKQKRQNKPKEVDESLYNEEPKAEDPFAKLDDVPPGLNNFLY